MNYWALAIFVATYLAIAAGRIPGLAVDRTGFALLGAMAFLATGMISLEQAREAVDLPTIVLLFGMMLLSAQYRTSGLYTAIAGWLGRVERPRWLLLGTIAATAALSAVLTNDVVCFALTPLVAEVAWRAGMKPLPYLLAVACASNLGSALTPIGNPQNILISQSRGLPFAGFVSACFWPVVLSLAVLYALLAWRLDASRRAAAEPAPTLPEPTFPEPLPLDRRQAAKAVVATVVVVALFFTPIPTYLVALGLAGVILSSRKLSTRHALQLVDGQLLAFFAGLFIVVRGFELSGWQAWARDQLAGADLDLGLPLPLLLAVTLLSNVFGNVPTVMFLLPFLPAGESTAYQLALFSTFAGNAVLVGSVANLIVAEQAARLDIPFRFLDHLRVGLPVTLASLAVALLTTVW